MSINFHFADKRFFFKDSEKRKKWIKKCVHSEGFKIVLVDIMFCSDEFLLDINREFLKHNYFTDIITFSDSSSSDLKGEIFISIDRVKENANTFQVDFNSELNRIIIHGFLHLMGYNDSSVAEKKLMTSKENACLSLF